MADLTILWLRRDLRVHDNAALAAAMAAGGPFVPLYIFEPDHWRRADTSGRQFSFLIESLADLDGALRQRGSQLCLRTGEATEVLSRLHLRHGIGSLHFHAVQGNPVEMARDQKVRNWALKAGIPLREHAPSARPGMADDAWEIAWQQRMRQARLSAPSTLPPLGIASEEWPDMSDFGLEPDKCPHRQTGGRTAAILQLRRFLSGAGRNGAKANLSILARDAAASRLSAHLALGNLSEREAWQGAMTASAALLADGDETFAAALENFAGKLFQRARHQMVPAPKEHTGISVLPRDTHDRPAPDLTDPRLSAWAYGQTGFPLLDASMRCLRETGHLDSSLRNLVLSFATCHLWLGPLQPCQILARLCTDFDPALFYGNARQVIGISQQPPSYIPNPVRQALARDPDGAFIRKWVPELAALSDRYLHSPWEAPKSTLSAHGIILGQTYPMRLVDHAAAAREARRRLSPARISRELPFQPMPPKRLSKAPRSTLAAHKPAPDPIQLSFDLQNPA